MVIVVLCLFLGCEAEPAMRIPGSPFYPVRISDSWKIIGENGGEIRYQVLSIQPIDGRRYWVIGCSSRKSGQEFVRYLWLDEDGNIKIRVSAMDSLLSGDSSLSVLVFSRDSSWQFSSGRVSVPKDGLSMWYKLDAQPHEQWQAIEYFRDYGLRCCRITLLSRSDTVWYGNTLLSGCLKFEFDIMDVSDEEWYEWLAPGIGLVKTQNRFWKEFEYRRAVKSSGATSLE